MIQSLLSAIVEILLSAAGDAIVKFFGLENAVEFATAIFGLSYEAISKNRSGLGWIVNIVVSVIGGFVAVSFAGMAMETMLTQLHFEGSLMSSQHHLLYVSVTAIAILTVLGSWIPLQIVDRFRS